MAHVNLSPTLGVRCNTYSQPIGKALDGWQACTKLPDTILTGRSCKVVPYDIAHVAALYQAYDHSDKASSCNAMWTYMPFGPFANSEELHAATIDRIQNGGLQTFVIMALADEQPIGQCSYLNYNLAHGSVEIGALCFSPALKRSTVATEAMYLMMQRAFDHGYRRYEWKCDQLNIASNTAALRLGFQFEGTFRNAMVLKGRRRDTCWYSVIVEDWPAVNTRLSIWLQPNNFEEDGSQKIALSSIL